jgi:acyl carrier protein
LVAYIVSTEEDSPSLSDLLHAYLNVRLPDYMVPTHFVILEQLPLNPSGKVDYQALPRVDENLSRTLSPSSNPQNEIQAKLCDIFRQVLAREQVRIEDNFFRLGGHSLLAAETAARIREAFGIGLELRAFFDSPTVAGLANAIKIRLKPANATSGMEDTTREEIEL